VIGIGFAMSSTSLVIVVIFAALLFDYINGFRHAPNSIANVVSTRMLRPRFAVFWAAFFNFVAFAILGTGVAKAIGEGVNIHLIAPDLRLYVLLAGIIGATLWSLTTWYLGLPTSSSHALMGGYAGGAIAAYGDISGLLRPEVYVKTVIFIIASPLIAMTLGFSMMVVGFWMFQERLPSRVDKYFRRGQLLSAAAYSLGHGSNDAQKTMGVITVALVAGGFITSGPDGRLLGIPLWVVLAAHAAIALGTLVGSWRLVHTMGYKITKQPFGGFCAETSGALTLFGATLAGIPVSTTHTITGAIVGVNATRRFSPVRWGMAQRILWGWALTIPMAGAFAALFFFATSAIHKIIKG
jgi:PiT family inorganic phosphate transporter